MFRTLSDKELDDAFGALFQTFAVSGDTVNFYGTQNEIVRRLTSPLSILKGLITTNPNPNVPRFPNYTAKTGFSPFTAYVDSNIARTTKVVKVVLDPLSGGLKLIDDTITTVLQDAAYVAVGLAVLYIVLSTKK
jgi:hypothetical protein